MQLNLENIIIEEIERIKAVYQDNEAYKQKCGDHIVTCNEEIRQLRVDIETLSEYTRKILHL